MIYLGAIHKKINLGNLNVTQNLCRKQKRLREYISKVLFYILKPKCVIFRGDSDDSFYFLSFMNCCFYILSIIINEGTSYNIFFFERAINIFVMWDSYTPKSVWCDNFLERKHGCENYNLKTKHQGINKSHWDSFK